MHLLKAVETHQLLNSSKRTYLVLFVKDLTLWDLLLYMKIKDLITDSGYFRIKVIPNQPQIELRGLMADNTLKIALKAAPEKGKANKELIKFLSTELEIPSENIKISSGLTSRIKVLSIELKYPQ